MTRNAEDMNVLAALHALGALDGEDVGRFQQLRGEANRQELDLIDEYEKVAGLIGLSQSPSSKPPDDVKKKILARLGGQAKAGLPNEATQEFSFLYGDKLEWMKHPVEGVQFAQLSLDAERRYATLLFKVEPGTVYPPHHHTGPEECYVIQGDLRIGDVVLHAGDFTHADTGSDHVPLSTENGCLLLLVVAATDYLPS
jgi:anti-sigma factor ChrR (cupin superfamily)